MTDDDGLAVSIGMLTRFAHLARSEEVDAKVGRLVGLGHVHALDRRDVERHRLAVDGGVQNRGCGLEVSDLRGDLGANERVEMGITCLGGE